MDFTKIKHAKGSVTLAWSAEAGTDTTNHTLTSLDEPRKEFTDALAALGPIVVRLLGLPEEYNDDLTVTSVSLSYNDHQGRGCVITCLKKLAKFTAPLVINTPHIAEGNEHGPSMPGELIEALDAVVREAVLYKNGQRMQSDMFEEAA